MRKRILRFSLLLPLLGCSETDILKYQGRPAMTALECQSAYQAARSRSSSGYVDYSNRGSAIGSAIGKGIASGMMESSYKTCLGRVAGLPAGSAVASSPAMSSRPNLPAPAPRVVSHVGCIPGGGVLQGGTSYCIGN
jgi:hypothetical protein